MKIVNLVVLHNTEGSSDKVWGYFQDEDTGKWHKFWGKRLANSYQARSSSQLEGRDDLSKKLKRGYIEHGRSQNSAITSVYNTVKKILEKQFEISGITPPKKKSAVTGQEMDAPIRPSKVARTEERWDAEDKDLVIVFYEEFSRFLGKRPFSEKKAIFDHLKKTKEEINADRMTGDDLEGHTYTYINWEEKIPT